MNRGRILVVEDDDTLRRVVQVQLEEDGYTVTTAASGEDAMAVLAAKPQDLVITDLSMPGISGLDLLREVRASYPDTAVILITAYATAESAVEAMKLGAYDYVTKPVDPENLRRVVGHILEHLSLREEVQVLRRTLDERDGFQHIVGRSDAISYVLDKAARAARSDATVLILGETGTGKELLAQAIHLSSARRTKPFITVNCGAIPAALLESELFGHVKGAFTGALANKKGKLELADEGTAFLDEVGELSPELQIKLLRVIQDHEIEKLGATEKLKINVRIVAATNRDLPATVRSGRFRQDLYYRLNVVPIEVPPLRQRSEDIPELVQHFFAKARSKHSRPNLRLPSSLLQRFSTYGWPGNVRELENAVERLVVLAPGEEVTAEDLPDTLRWQQEQSRLMLELPPQGVSLEAVEKELILQALIRFQWNQTQAARFLNLSRKTLIYRMEKFGIKADQAR